MKKHLVIALAAFSATLFSQTTIQLRHVQNGNLVLAPNAIIYEVTGANKITSFDLDVTNTGTATNSYRAKRYDVVLNGAAEAYFCFAGNCYPSSTDVSPNPTTLGPGVSTSNSTDDYQMLTADLQEDVQVGVSKVKYTFFNEANPSDSLQISVYYNVAAPVGIKETSKSLSSFEIFPNPAKETTSILVSSSKSFDSQVILYNSIGKVVYQKQVSMLEGKNKIELNVEMLPAGVYFTSIKTADATVTKKLIIN